LNILIIEDEKDLVADYKYFLELNGHHVTEAFSGEEGLEKFHTLSQKQNPPFIVVLDYHLPKKDGMQVAKEMLDSNPKQRIIFASAYVEDTLRESITKLGQIVELLQKPFSLKTLNDTINDKEIYADLEKLNVDIKNLKDVEPTHAQIRDYLELMKKSQSHNN
jgi:DNA-binding response OmpR family regulator